MNDDELNEIIARTDEETVLFRQIDIQRDREAQEKWKAAGNRGKPPVSLIQLEELPECYRNDTFFEIKDDFEENSPVYECILKLCKHFPPGLKLPSVTNPQQTRTTSPTSSSSPPS